MEQEGDEISSKRIWEFIQEKIQGELYSSNEYHIADYILYRSTVTKLLEDKFGAEPPKHTKKGNIVVFNLEKKKEGEILELLRAEADKTAEEHRQGEHFMDEIEKYANTLNKEEKKLFYGDLNERWNHVLREESKRLRNLWK